jgi:hypothetical protein
MARGGDDRVERERGSVDMIERTFDRIRSARDDDRHMVLHAAARQLGALVAAGRMRWMAAAGCLLCAAAAVGIPGRESIRIIADGMRAGGRS